MPSQQLSSLCEFDHVYGQVLTPFFGTLDDTRAYNYQYSLNDALKSGFAIYSLKAASLFAFRQMAQAEEYNLASIYRIGDLPSDNGLRKILDQVNPNDLRKGFDVLFEHTLSTGVLNAFHYWRNYLMVSIDGVQHFQSKQVSCAHCLEQRHRDGSVSHSHSLLSAAIVCPGQSEVFPLDHEPIIIQDGSTKNDCERNAAHRLIDRLQSIYYQRNMLLCLDALYSCNPIIERIEQQPHWRYIIGITEAGHTHLFEQFDQLNEAGKVHWQECSLDDGHYSIGYVNKLSLNASATNTKVNMMYVVHTNRKGKETIFSYVTNIALSKRNVYKIMRMGRSRWKIENETFNTLKNQGYHFEHNYGHGQQHLCTVMAYLMMMAFWVDQLQQAGSRIFQQILSGLKTRVKLWESLRAVFKIIPVQSMHDIYINVAQMYCIRLI